MLVRHLARRVRRSRRPVSLTVAVLATEWRRAPDEVARLAAETCPHVALHFGVAASTPGLRIETLAENEATLQADACGWVPTTSRLSSRGPATQASTFPSAAILARLAELGIPAEASSDAGRYLCNAVLYRSLTSARREKAQRLTGFVHIPAELALPTRAAEPAMDPASSLQSLNWQQAVQGGLAIIDVCLAHVVQVAHLPATVAV